MSILRAREVPLGGLRAMTVRRTLPNRERITIGAWCFVDHFGPDRVADTGGMSVAPHPHTGLQTVSWLFAGKVEHRDSVGSHQMIAPGQLNLMTAGSGISHSEVSNAKTDVLHGVQLWIALPDADRFVAPFFEHVIPSSVRLSECTITVFVGDLAGVSSPAVVFSPLVGAEILMPAHTELTFDVRAEFEHGVLIDSGVLAVNGERAEVSDLVYCGVGASTLTLNSGDQPVRAVLLGGEPFREQLVMWWNFIGRTHDEVVAFRDAWQHDVIEAARRDGPFGSVPSDDPSIAAPEMPRVRLRPRGQWKP
jgi:redox-sensitive bicupin YhaK (pirin superfamily)